jgi:multimeric flavodoxin WrbA
MKVVAFNGSPRKNGNTALMIGEVFKVLEREGIECELVQIGGQLIRGCQACLQCRELQNRKCTFDDDILNECVEKMIEADGIIIGSPTYFASMTAETKALIDRAGYVTRGNGVLLKGKVGAAVTAVRRAGALNVFQGINNFLFVSEMILPGSSYWNLAIGRGIGEVHDDEEGMKTMETLGENMAWLLKKLNS